MSGEFLHVNAFGQLTSGEFFCRPLCIAKYVKLSVGAVNVRKRCLRRL